MSDHHHGCGSLLAFITGAAVGGALALLLAPRSGAETREKMREKADELKNKADELKNKAQDFVADAESRVREVVEEGKDIIDENKDVILSAVAAGKEAFDKVKSPPDETA